MKRPHVAFLTSHPIQYQAPLFRALAVRDDLELTVLFCSDHGARAYHDAGFATTVRWDVPLCDGYRHEFLPNLRRGGGSASPLGLVNPGIVTALRSGRFRALVVHGWAHATNWLAFATASAIGLPFFIRGESSGLSEAGGVKGLLRQALLRQLFRRAAGLLAIGTLNRRFYERHGVVPARIGFTPYAVDNAFFREAADTLVPGRERLRREHDIPAEASVFLFCGKLTPVKRPMDVVEAFARLSERQTSCLIFIGDGPLRAELEARARALGLGNVRFVGFRNQSELSRFYAVSDVLVLPSAFEPWGLVVNEAMNFGLAVVASDQVGAAVDLVRPGETGRIFPSGDIGALAAAMRECASGRMRGRAAVASRGIVDGWSAAAAADGIAAAVVRSV
jgi:glycosyltransferase involved in cell wall biosynthesis